VAWFTVFLVGWIVVSIGRDAMPSMHAYGLHFLSGTVWDANRERFGILPAIVGTLYSSILGLVIGTVFGLAIAVFLSEHFCPRHSMPSSDYLLHWKSQGSPRCRTESRMC
jgi:phosphate transport system permease protein